MKLFTFDLRFIYNLFLICVPFQKKMYLILFILKKFFAFGDSYLLVNQKMSQNRITNKSNHSRRAVQRYPPDWNFTTISPDYEAPYNKYFQPYKPRLTFGLHIQKMRTVSEIEKIFSFDASVTVWLFICKIQLDSTLNLLVIFT